MLMIRSNGDLEIQWFARLSLGIVSSSTGEIHLSELDKDLFQLCPCRKFNCIICSPLQQCSSLKWPKHLPGQEMEPGAGLQPGPTPFFFLPNSDLIQVKNAPITSGFLPPPQPLHVVEDGDVLAKARLASPSWSLTLPIIIGQSLQFPRCTSSTQMTLRPRSWSDAMDQF